MRRVAILGSTGSIGRQALQVISALPDRFTIVALAANESVDVLAEQANAFKPAVLSAGTPERARELTEKLAYAPRQVVSGVLGLEAVACESGADIVLAATDGLVALQAVAQALSRGTDVALANKELAVAAGEVLFTRAKASGARILPVDSEHSAVHQCLAGEEPESIKTIVLTASGGPFWRWPLARMREAKPEQALDHPTWSMGPKNSLDSATLMNKGLEIIEATRFFGVRPEQLDVVVHPQSVAHAFVIFTDGSVKAQLSWPDMRTPIGYALSYPKRLERAESIGKTREVIGLGERASNLTFEPVDHARFPAIRLARRALAAGGTAPAVLSAANEEAGRAYLRGNIKFTEIAALVEQALDAHDAVSANLPAIVKADAQAHEFVRHRLGELSRT